MTAVLPSNRTAGRSHPGRRLGHVDPARLDEVPFEELVCRLAFGRSRGAEARTWNRLVEADLVARTDAALRRAQERNDSAMSTRRQEWSRYVEDRVGVRVDAGEWAMARQEYDDWCRRAEAFAAGVAKALKDVERAQRRSARAVESKDLGVYRRQLKAVARAIHAHRVASEDAEVIAEDHDLRLWSALESVTVPDGPLSEPRSLMDMLNERHGS